MNAPTLRRRWYRTLEVVPAAYCAWNRRHPGRKIVDAHTDLLIEGYPSAANTYAREAIGYANQEIRIASHRHSPAHLRRALQLDVPVLVLLRPPVESVVSVLGRFPDLASRSDVATELGDYEHFYRSALPVADRVVLSRFEDTTSRLGDVVRLLNDRFGTSFVPYDDNDPESKRIVQLKIDGWTQHVFGPESERHRALPSEQRHAETAGLRAELESPSHAAARARCEALHDQLAAVASAQIGDRP